MAIASPVDRKSSTAIMTHSLVSAIDPHRIAPEGLPDPAIAVYEACRHANRAIPIVNLATRQQLPSAVAADLVYDGLLRLHRPAPHSLTTLERVLHALRAL